MKKKEQKKIFKETFYSFHKFIPKVMGGTDEEKLSVKTKKKVQTIKKSVIEAQIPLSFVNRGTFSLFNND